MLLAVVVAVAAGGTAGCSHDKTGSAAKRPQTTAPAATSEPATAAPATGPVTDADVTEVDQVLRRLDTELDRLDSDLTTGEGDVQ